MFVRGGTMQETGAGGNPALRGPGFGTWSHQSRRRYSSVFQFFRFAPDGAFIGVQKVRRQTRLSRDASEFNATASFENIDAAGNLTATGCATETATRLQ